jgi:hypothetical protein
MSDDVKVSPKWLERQKEICAQLVKENTDLKRTIEWHCAELASLTEQLNQLRAQISEKNDA